LRCLAALPESTRHGPLGPGAGRHWCLDPGPPQTGGSHGLLRHPGREILDVCRQLGISVPDQVGLIGVDNDELICDLADPPLSSVIPDTRRTGYEAARLLDLVMAGQLELPLAHLIQPLGIAVRSSTGVLATDDADLSAGSPSSARTRAMASTWRTRCGLCPYPGESWRRALKNYWAARLMRKSRASRSSASRSCWWRPTCRWRPWPTAPATSTSST
jgi:hypothetical protein